MRKEPQVAADYLEETAAWRAGPAADPTPRLMPTRNPATRLRRVTTKGGTDGNRGQARHQVIRRVSPLVDGEADGGLRTGQDGR